MHEIARWTRLFVAAVSILPGALAAQEPWLDRPFAAPPAEVLRAAEALRPKADASVHVLLEAHTWVFDAGGRQTRTTRQVFEILKDDARDDWGTVDAVWKPWRDEKPILRARVVRRDGTVLDLDPSTVAERPLHSGQDVFDDRRVFSAPLPGLEVGAVVELETTERSTRPFPAGDRASVSFGSSFPRRRTRVSVTVPEGFPFVWRARGPGDVPVQESRAGGAVTRVWETVDTAANRDWEWSVPSDVLQSPLVEFGTGESWAAVADTYREIVEARLKNAPFGQWARKAAGPPGLLAYVQKDIRYTSIAFGEAAIVPQAPGDVVGRRFGDCKDQATLLVGLLRSRGETAWVALLRAGSGRDIHPEVPALAGFDHAIVYVEGRGGAPGTWVDPTSSFARWGELPEPDQGRWALVCRPGADALVKTPSAAAGADHEIRTMDVHLAEDGKGSAVETVEFHGSFEADARASYDGLDAIALRKRGEHYVQSSLANGKLIRASTTPSRDLEVPFRKTVEAEKVGFAVTTSAEAVVRIGRSVLLDLAPNPSDEKRRFPLAVRPFESRIEYRVAPPRGYVLRQMPPPGTGDVGPLKVSTESEQRPDGSVDVRFVVAMSATRLTPEEAVTFAKARKDFDRLGPITISFDSRVERALEQGDARAAVAERNAAVHLAPKNADAHRRLANTLLRIGLGSAAIREAHAAVALDAASPAAWHELGLALQVDRFGRLHRGVWDLSGAEKALEKAVDLDPERVEYRIDRAILFEFDAKGSRYADRERLGRAIALYEGILKDRPDLTVVRDNYVLALLYAGRPADATRYLESLGDDGRRPALVAGWALSLGPEAALEKAHRLWGDPTERRDAEEKAALILLFLRRYAPAAEVLSDAAKGSPRAGELSARSDLFRRLKPMEGLDPLPGDAASVVRALFARLLSGEPVERLSPLFLGGEKSSPFITELRTFMVGFLGQVASTGLPKGVTQDLSFAAMEFRAEGDAGSDWKARADLGLTSATASSFVVRLAAENGEPRIVGFDLDPEAYVRLALKLARAGDLPGAARWLDRTLDLRPPKEQEGDPLRGPLLPLFWSRSDPARARRDAVVLACAADLARPKSGVETLGDARTALAANPDDRRLAFVLERTLAANGKLDEALEVARRWAAREPEAVVWALEEAAILGESDRYSDAVRLMTATHAKWPRDLMVRRVLQGLEGSVGSFGRAVALGDEIVGMPDAGLEDWNNLAWFRMLDGRNDAETLRSARRAVDGSARMSAVSLNTLAAVLVEQGQLKEGYDVVIEAMGKTGSDEPVNADWYVLGRILEGYGFIEDAADAYRRVVGKVSDAAGVAALAGKRLAALKGVVPARAAR